MLSLFSPPTQCLQLSSAHIPHLRISTATEASPSEPHTVTSLQVIRPWHACQTSAFQNRITDLHDPATLQICMSKKPTQMTLISSTANSRYSVVSYYRCRSLHMPWQLNLGKHLPNRLGFLNRKHLQWHSLFSFFHFKQIWIFINWSPWRGRPWVLSTFIISSMQSLRFLLHNFSCFSPTCFSITSDSCILF